MAKQSITLKVAGRSYAFDIESEKEELYRLAEREVNTYLSRITQMRYENWTDRDYLSMTALQFAIAYMTLRQSREVGNEDMKRLQQLERRLDEYLNALDQ